MTKPTGKRRAYSAEYKLEAVGRLEAALAAGETLGAVARALGVRADMLRAWAQQAGARLGQPAADVFPGAGHQPAVLAELTRLERENTRLRQENEFLKKAAAYFAKISQ